MKVHLVGDQCPGSDDEDHHCEECGWLWMDDKGCYCEMCNKYYCPTYWQNNFIMPDEFTPCNDCKDGECMSICPDCFKKHKEYWCKSNNPKCTYNMGHVQTKLVHCSV